MSIKRWAAKRDRNEPEIVEALLKAGATVVRISEENVPDLLVGFRGHDYKLEVKAPGGRLTPGQTEFHESWRGEPPIVVWSAAEALIAIGALGE